MIIATLDVLTILALLFGLFFMFTGALGIWRLPDFFNRTHAASMCVTLGISGLLVAAVLRFATLSQSSQEEATAEQLLGAATKAALVLIFLFTAAPVGSHMLVRSAHLDQAEKDDRMVDDDLDADGRLSEGVRSTR